MPAADPTSFTGSSDPLVTRVEELELGRRRIHWLLPNGERTVTTIRQVDDSDDLRERLADALVSKRRLVIRGGEAVEG